MIRVMLVDDHAVLRTGLKLLLEQQPDVVVVAEAADAATAEADLARVSPDVVVTDLSMPGMSGVDLVHHLRERHPDLRALVVSGNPPPVEAKGALEFLQKPYTLQALSTRIRRLLQGGDGPS